MDTTDYAVLNGVALKKMATASAIAAASGLDEPDVAAVLDRLAASGLLLTAAGSALPTDAAGPALASAAATRYAALRQDAGIAALADRFDPVNQQFLTTMSSWQQIDVGGRKVANDHSDPAYDAKVVTRLARLVDRLGPLLDALAAFDPRFSHYGRRFDAAVEGIDAGAVELVASPTVDSVHNIWFEFHEDLLRTLGRTRTE
ncbi:hypothetical protein [Cryptosporangium sp. NPDC051539]|uniref:hypothetical protein n=1 Tax=Cryptosporangium sp. NPDC051539 TaxID=3363962 RepID=UPI0037A5F174